MVSTIYLSSKRDGIYGIYKLNANTGNGRMFETMTVAPCGPVIGNGWIYFLDTIAKPRPKLPNDPVDCWLFKMWRDGSDRTRLFNFKKNDVELISMRSQKLYLNLTEYASGKKTSFQSIGLDGSERVRTLADKKRHCARMAIGHIS